MKTAKERPTEEAARLEDGTVMTMLKSHVPLALICDLTVPEGPPSAEILAEEGQPDDAWWEQ